ncbi:Meiotic recombination protein rec8 [Paramyrothecium foliicola]|nr:Meiotic recombination protein rec8 [Paramyrothecium foliicola]
MFYSHEILSNSQYGVSTIWLAATSSKTSQKRLTRKAIQEVNVPKACGTILDPGAPLALRLQGNFLYGVTRVFSQQCNYVLSDAEKTQSNMMTFFRVMQTSEIDPQAGKSKRNQITLEDDPSFDPWSTLPNLDLLNTQENGVFGISQGSVKYSQFSPADMSNQHSLTPGHIGSFYGFDLPASSKSSGSYRIPSDLDGHSSLLVKETQGADTMGEFKPFEIDDGFHPFNDIGLDFDADGNMVGLVDLEEPELPPLVATQHGTSKNVQHLEGLLDQGLDEEILGTGDDGVLIMGEDVLPDADGFTTRPAAKNITRSFTQSTDSTESEKATAPSRRTRAKKFKSMMDERIDIPRHELRAGNLGYVENMTAQQRAPTRTTAAQAKRNAMNYVFGNGIAGVGMSQGESVAPHPLAEMFSGIPLVANLYGLPTEELSGLVPKDRGRRRKATEAIDIDEHVQDERRVRQRVEESQEFGRGTIAEDEQLILGDDTMPEIAMEAEAALEDRHSSSAMPWSRAGSVAPGSSVRGHGSARKGLQAPSPLFGSAAKLSQTQQALDNAAHFMGSDDFGFLRSQDSSMEYDAITHGPAPQVGDNSQAQSSWLDLASQDFLQYATDQAIRTGVARDSPNTSSARRWIEFEQLANPEVSERPIAVQAFLHVLSLATKGVIVVKQDGRDQQIPFGTIHIGLSLEGGALEE